MSGGLLSTVKAFLDDHPIDSIKPSFIQTLIKIYFICLANVLRAAVFCSSFAYFLLFRATINETDSSTSNYVATLRYISYLSGTCDDYMAIDFLSFGDQILVFCHILYFYCRQGSEDGNLLGGRCKFGDEAIKNNPDMQQIVILGAGKDTRLHRMPNLPGALFEVDAPKPQEVKLQKLSKVNPNVKFVPVNFEKTSWIKELEAYGFDKKKKTLFIWEGVIYYLNREAINDTLSSISQCAEGSKLVLDYVGMDDSWKMRMIKWYLSFIGETWKSSFAEGELTNLLKQYNLVTERVVNPKISTKAKMMKLSFVCALLQK